MLENKYRALEVKEEGVTAMLLIQVFEMSLLSL
jgi:hypothetical protein